RAHVRNSQLLRIRQVNHSFFHLFQTELDLDMRRNARMHGPCIDEGIDLHGLEVRPARVLERQLCSNPSHGNSLYAACGFANARSRKRSCSSHSLRLLRPHAPASSPTPPCAAGFPPPTRPPCASPPSRRGRRGRSPCRSDRRRTGPVAVASP